MIPMLEEARGLREECRRLTLEAIERPEQRPSFHNLFRDVHAFSRGVGNVDRVTALAEGLAQVVGIFSKGSTDSNETTKTVRGVAVLLQEEAVWQGAAGAFVRRLRSDYSEAYVDVVTGVSDAVEMTRLGLRLLAAACVNCSSVARKTRGGLELEHAGVAPLVRLQEFLLSFPYTCCQGSALYYGHTEKSRDSLCTALEFALDPAALGDAGCGGGKSHNASGAQHMTVLEVFIDQTSFLTWCFQYSVSDFVFLCWVVFFLPRHVGIFQMEYILSSLYLSFSKFSIFLNVFDWYIAQHVLILCYLLRVLVVVSCRCDL